MATYSKWVNGKQSKKLKKSSTYKVVHKNSKGHPVKVTRSSKSTDGSSSTSAPVTYKYDSKGNVTQNKTSYSTTKYKNTYKSGRLATRKIGDTTYVYKYKKKSVSVAAASVVADQQWNLINGGLNAAFGPLSLGTAVVGGQL